MRLNNLKESFEFDESEIEDMELSDALFLLAEMSDDDKLSDKEIEIIEEMLDRIFDEEDDTLTEAEIRNHADSKKERIANARKSTSADRLANRLYQRRRRRRSDVKMKASRRAAKQKSCSKTQSAQVTRLGASSFTCRLKNKFRSKLMTRIAKRYR